MKSEADVWRLNEISVTVRLPLADPDFLKTMEDRQRAQNEQMAMWALRSIETSENPLLLNSRLALSRIRSRLSCLCLGE